MSSFYSFIRKINSVKCWKAAVTASNLYRKIQFYYVAVKDMEPVYILKRYDRIYFVKKQIKKLLPKRIIKATLFFHLVENYGFFKPINIERGIQTEVQKENYFETLLQWNKFEKKKFLKEHPLPRRHNKIIIYKRKTIRL